jgi:hypothetical protein
MDVARSQLCPQTVSITGKAEKGMETTPAKVAIVGNTFLAAVCRVIAGVNINNQAPLVFASQEDISRPYQRIIECY